MHGIELLIGLSVIAASTVVVLCEEGKIEEIYVPGIRAVVEHNGRMTGNARSRQRKARIAEAKESIRLGAPTKEGEGEVLELNELYLKFLKRCSRSENMTTIPRKLQKFLDSNHLTEANVQDTCSRMYAEREERRNGRQKRSFIYSWTRKWDKCIIPFIKDPGLPDSWSSQLDKTIALYEKYTGFRFVAFNQIANNNSEFGLSHNNYLKFINGGGCWSYVGNGGGNGQEISPCSQLGTSVHEIGHAIGFNHEQKHPASMDYLTLLFDNINPDSFGSYARSSFSELWDADKFYDIASTMHYANYFFNVNGGLTMTAIDPDLDYLVGYDNFFYFFRDAQKHHNCFDQFPDCDPLPVCENGGYPTVFEGKCACRCPDGLDPATKCTTAPPKIVSPQQWPEGTFTVLKTTLGDCPNGFSGGRVSYENPSWAWSGGSLHSPGYQNGYTWHHDVCTQTSSQAGYEWPKGEYCILRYGGTCPSGFIEGLMEFSGNDPPAGGNTGTLPDGSHNALLQYQFCCRNDASRSESILLPNKEPFIMYMQSYWGCQQVEGMIVTQEYYHMKGAEDAGTEISGALPYYYAWNPGMINMYYCVYQPVVEQECGDIKQLSTGTSVEITTPSYPSDYAAGVRCMWHYQSPPGTTMRLDFEDFEIPESGSNCDGFIELKTYYPGIPGYSFCGSNNRRSRFTYENYLTVKFVGGQNGARGFNATVSVISDDDKCYKGSGRDGSYAGALNYTQYFTPCLPWSEVQDCLFDQFDPRMVDIDLTHNYCRNVGTGVKPWCYVEKDNCRRENCDACTTGYCYDLADDCASRVSDDPEYCAKNEQYEAHKFCMETCGRCINHAPMQSVQQVTCDAPEDVSCISAEPVKAAYSVGDVVTYSCPYSNDVRTRTCTSEGSWTVLNIVCNACPSGWTVVEQRCFKWLGWDTLLTNDAAKEACAALGGVLPKADTGGINYLLSELSDNDPKDMASVWVGMNDKVTNNVWVWDDGEPVTVDFWGSGEPRWNGGDCSVSYNAEWYAERCDDTDQTVCEFIISDTVVCADNLPNCMELLENMPDMCSLHPDYAWQNCRHTCAVGDCDFPTQCADEGVDGSGSMDGSSPINQGRHYAYACDADFTLTAGNLKRACLPSGQLTGEKPVCTAMSQMSHLELFVDRELHERDDSDDNKFYILPDSEAMAIPTKGNITEWTFYASSSGSVALQIWRPIESSTDFELIGSNVLVSTNDGAKMKVQIPSNEQIQARAGDLVGMVNLSPNIIQFTRCDSAKKPEHQGWLHSSDNINAVDDIEVGRTYSFAETEHGCRVYSIHATLNPCNCI